MDRLLPLVCGVCASRIGYCRNERGAALFYCDECSAAIRRQQKQDRIEAALAALAITPAETQRVMRLVRGNLS